jgi:hypothetical protein
MPPVSDDQRIRQGLKFLTKADNAVIRAADYLARLEGTPNSQGVGDLLEVVTFDVAGYTYKGKMTQEQYEYLQGFTTGSLGKFADALAKMLLNMNGKVVEAREDLRGALAVPAAKRVALAATGDGTPPTGCCTYGSNQQKNGITQAFCEGGLQGTWSPHPC